MSSYLYGNPDKLPTNESAKIKIENPYSLTKKIAEEFCQFYSRKYGLKVVILRPSNVYGPGQKNFFLIPDIINKFKSFIFIHSHNELRPTIWIGILNKFCKSNRCFNIAISIMGKFNRQII